MSKPELQTIRIEGATYDVKARRLDLDPNYDPYAKCYPDGIKPESFLKPAIDSLVTAITESRQPAAEMPVPFYCNPVPARILMHPSVREQFEKELGDQGNG